jgi:bacteriocin biosynthesis cyclodehydratase domain-containing protein
MRTRLGTEQLPTSMRPRPHHPLLHRGMTSAQFGVGHRDGLEVLDLSPALHQLLRRLAEDRAWAPAELVALGVELGASADEVRGLLAELYAHGALLDDGARRRVVRARRAAHVLVEGPGPLREEVALGLDAAGVGRLDVRTGQQDIGGAGPSDHEPVPGPPARPTGRPDLVVLTDAVSPDPVRLRGLLAQGVPHLLVRMADGVGLVGPLVLPRRTACADCIDRYRAASDPAWPRLRLQLAGYVGSASPAVLRATAALGTEQALLALDSLACPSTEPPTLDGVLELDLSTGRLLRREWPPHPECCCGAANTVPGLPAHGALTSVKPPEPVTG